MVQSSQQDEGRDDGKDETQVDSQKVSQVMTQPKEQETIPEVIKHESKDEKNIAKEDFVIDAMIGICIHDPETIVKPPSNVRDWASEALTGNGKSGLLSPDAKIGFFITQGSFSFEESEKIAFVDLPEQMKTYMLKNDLDPSAYNMDSFTHMWRSDLKVLCMIAARKVTSQVSTPIQAGEPAKPPTRAQVKQAELPLVDPPGEKLEIWAAEIKSQQKSTVSKRSSGCVLILAGVLVGGFTLWILKEYSTFGIVLGVLGLAVGIVMWIMGEKQAGSAANELSAKILQECQANNLPKAAVVEALWKQDVATIGDIGKLVLTKIDPHKVAILEIRSRAFEFFNNDIMQKIEAVKINVQTTNNTVSSVKLSGEEAIDRFTKITLDYLDQNAYIESIGSLAVLQSVYNQIAPPGGNFILQAAPDNNRLKQVSINTHQIFSNFNLTSEMKAIFEVLTKRQNQSILHTLLENQKPVQYTEQMLGTTEIDLTLFNLQDEVTIQACIDYLGKKTVDPIQRYKTAEVLALIPDQRITPYIIQAFAWFPFFPQGIDGLHRLGKTTVPELWEAFQSGSIQARFNTAMALGIIAPQEIQAELEAIYPKLLAPIERIGCEYALVRAGQVDRLVNIISALEKQDENVRLSAAIALEHLPNPLDEQVFLKHLDDKHQIVRLRLVRKTGTQKSSSPALRDALFARFEDSSPDVRSAAVKVLSQIDDPTIDERLFKFATSGSIQARTCAYQVLGKRSNRKAISLLLDGLKTASDNDLRRAAISALGEIGSGDVIDPLKTYIKNNELSHSVYMALMNIGIRESDVILQVLRSMGRKSKALAIRALLGDEDGIRQYKSLISTGTDIQTLLDALQFAPALRNPEFEGPLNILLTYRKHSNFPADRYVANLALKGLVQIKLSQSEQVVR